MLAATTTDNNMMELGKINRLKAIRQAPPGLYLGDETGKEVLLPNKYIPADLPLGGDIDVFLYNDSEDRLVATTLRPRIMLHEFAWLQVRDVNAYGAFVDWGLEKDLLVPYARQAKKMEKGRWYIIHLYLDEQSDRLVGASKLNSFFDNANCTLAPGEEVDLLAGAETDLGVNVIINQRYLGLVYHSDIFVPVQPGDRLKGYIKLVRPDFKIDVTLQQQGAQKIRPNADVLLTQLQQSSGFLPLNDKSAPDLIAARLGMSKKAFKQAVGTLYKQRRITISDEGIRLVK